MQITPDELLIEAGHLALEVRLKDRELKRLEAENADLRARLSPPDEEPDTKVTTPEVAQVSRRRKIAVSGQ